MTPPRPLKPHIAAAIKIIEDFPWDIRTPERWSARAIGGQRPRSDEGYRRNRDRPATTK